MELIRFLICRLFGQCQREDTLARRLETLERNIAQERRYCNERPSWERMYRGDGR